MITSNCFAKSYNPLCTIQEGQKLLPEIDKIQNDKAAHCTISCILTLRCNQVSTFYTGILKEVADLFGPGHAEYQDLVADFVGIDIANEIVTSENECFDICSEYNLVQ